MRIPLRFGRLKPLFAALGLNVSRSYVEIAGDDTVRVRMGWAFDSSFPRSSVRNAVRRKDAPLSIGVHGWGGSWLVNGAAGPLVTLTIDPPARARTLALPLRVHTLAVSVDDPDGLTTLLMGR